LRIVRTLVSAPSLIIMYLLFEEMGVPWKSHVTVWMDGSANAMQRNTALSPSGTLWSSGPKRIIAPAGMGQETIRKMNDTQG